MPHPLVQQLRFARSEFTRCLQGVTEEEAVRRFLPMNCLSWMVGHLADQENRYWVMIAQKETLHPELNALVGWRKPASTPPLAEMWAAWKEITARADAYLDTITPARLLEHFEWKGKMVGESAGTLLQRNLYHYWFHTGECSAIRQQLGHTNLPDFVGDFTGYEYRPE